MEELIMSFDSTQQALRAEMLLEFHELEIDIRPTPKGITAGCALSIGFDKNELDVVTSIVYSEDIEIKGIFREISGAEFQQIVGSTIRG